MKGTRPIDVLKYIPLAVVVGFLTFYLHSPYIVTLWILLGWASLGHLVTLDDDMPGGWTNQESDPAIWRRSRLWLLMEFTLFILVGWIMYTYPDIRKFGW